MASVDTARLLALIGGILSTVFGTIYILWGIFLALVTTALLGVGPVIYGILSIIFGALTLTIAKNSLVEGDFRTGGIMCIVFGGVSAGAIGGIVTIVAGVLGILAWHEETKAVKVMPPPTPEVKVAYCSSCGAQLAPGAAFCPSCGKKVKK